LWAVALDNFQAVYTVKDKRVEVLRILPREATGECKLRSKEWLIKIQAFLTN